ncbi:MAG: DUF2058 family protein [Myxococcales bacterium]|nr:DUF2058 family protein [Myxococcales bacterium]
MSLRDALLKAGKVNKGQAQRAAADDRRERRQKGGHAIEAEAQAEQSARDAQRRAEQAEANRARAEAERVAREAAEARMRIANLIRAWTRRPRRDARHAWHFVRSSGRIGRVLVDRELAAELEYGSVGIVELPDAPDSVRLVAAEGIRKLIEVFPSGVRFYVGRDAPADSMICPPPRALD